MVIVALPMVVHVVPLVLLLAVMTLPTRTRRTQMFGAVPVLLLVLLVLPPVVVRRIHLKAPLPLSARVAEGLVAVSVSRI